MNAKYMKYENQIETVPDTVLLKQLKQGNSPPYQSLYRFYFPSIGYYIVKNQGKRADAENIFQESLLVLQAKLKEPDFVLTPSVNTYLYALPEISG